MPTTPAHQSQPSPWVARWLPAVDPGGSVLDVACGRGRHIAVAVLAGHRVTGIDRDLAANAFAAHPQVDLIEVDLETDAGWPLAGRRFDGVIVTNYLHRPILAEIVGAVADGGVLIYETFALGQKRLGRPSRAEFLLRPGELIDAVKGRLVPLAYEIVHLANPERIVQRIAAVGPSHRWLADPLQLPPQLSLS